MTAKKTSTSRVVICIENEGNEASLQLRKLYRTLPDPEAEALGMIRVIDEEEEDYLYSKNWFVPVKLPTGAARLFDDGDTKVSDRSRHRSRSTSRR